MQIKSFTPENKLPPGLLSGGVESVREGTNLFIIFLIIFLKKHLVILKKQKLLIKLMNKDHLHFQIYILIQILNYIF
jgi:hypothetical protein